MIQDWKRPRYKHFNLMCGEGISDRWTAIIPGEMSCLFKKESRKGDRRQKAQELWSEITSLGLLKGIYKNCILGKWSTSIQKASNLNVLKLHKKYVIQDWKRRRYKWYRFDAQKMTLAMKIQVIIRNNPRDENASPRSRRLLPESHLHRCPIPNFFTNGIQNYQMRRVTISKESAKVKIWTYPEVRIPWRCGWWVSSQPQHRPSPLPPS